MQQFRCIFSEFGSCVLVQKPCLVVSWLDLTCSHEGFQSRTTIPFQLYNCQNVGKYGDNTSKRLRSKKKLKFTANPPVNMSSSILHARFEVITGKTKWYCLGEGEWEVYKSREVDVSGDSSVLWSNRNIQNVVTSMTVCHLVLCLFK